MKVKCVSVRSDGTFSVHLKRLDTGVDVMSLPISEKVLSPRVVDPTVEPTEKNIGALCLQSTAVSVQISCVFPVECVQDLLHDVFVSQFHKSQLLVIIIIIIVIIMNWRY